MADVHIWEKRFVKIFIRKEKQDRYLSFLKEPKHRQKILERFNHTLDFKPSLAQQLPPAAKEEQYLTEYLQSLYVADTCHFMADGNELDGQELRLERAVEEFLNNCWGALIICPPKPIVIYKEEDPGQLLLLAKKPHQQSNIRRGCISLYTYILNRYKLSTTHARTRRYFFN